MYIYDFDIATYVIEKINTVPNPYCFFVTELSLCRRIRKSLSSSAARRK